MAFFLFLMFLPIVVLAFQLWWMLALRFCIPPSIGFSAMADFLATGKLLVDIDADLELKAELNIAFGTDIELLDLAPSRPRVGAAALRRPGPGDRDAGLRRRLQPHPRAGRRHRPERRRVPEPLPREVSPDDPLCLRPATAMTRHDSALTRP